MKRPVEEVRRLDRPNRNGSHEDRVMATKPLPSPEVLRQLLRYDPETGSLFWLERVPSMFKPGLMGSGAVCSAWNSRHAGHQADKISKLGYRQLKIFDTTYFAHRVAWEIAFGGIPSGGEIDHMNGDRSDNRVCNLRLASRIDNAKNLKKPSHNTSGHIGVRLEKGKWVAFIGLDGKKMTIGRFFNMADAVLARKMAEVKYGYHANHGRNLTIAEAAVSVAEHAQPVGHGK